MALMLGTVGVLLSTGAGTAALTRGWVPGRERHRVRHTRLYGFSMFAGGGTLGCATAAAQLAPDAWLIPLIAAGALMVAWAALRFRAMTGPCPDA